MNKWMLLMFAMNKVRYLRVQWMIANFNIRFYSFRKWLFDVKSHNVCHIWSGETYIALITCIFMMLNESNKKLNFKVNIIIWCSLYYHRKIAENILPHAADRLIKLKRNIFIWKLCENRLEKWSMHICWCEKAYSNHFLVANNCTNRIKLKATKRSEMLERCWIYG